jgi:hypothetical protein
MGSEARCMFDLRHAGLSFETHGDGLRVCWPCGSQNEEGTHQGSLR